LRVRSKLSHMARDVTELRCACNPCLSIPSFLINDKLAGILGSEYMNH